MAIITSEGSFVSSDAIVSGVGTASSAELIEAIKNTNDLTERAKETVNNHLENYSGEDFKSFSEFLDIGFSPETIETLQNCTEIIQLFLQ